MYREILIIDFVFIVRFVLFFIIAMRLIANPRRAFQLVQESVSSISSVSIKVNPDVMPSIPVSEIKFKAINHITADNKVKDTATMVTNTREARPTIKF